MGNHFRHGAAVPRLRGRTVASTAGIGTDTKLLTSAIVQSRTLDWALAVASVVLLCVCLLAPGTPLTIANPRLAMAHGIAYSTEDRRQLGLIMPLSIAANISLPSLPRYLSPAGLVRRGDERAAAETYRERLTIRAPSVDTPASALSGGNQQKVVISKWLETSPKVLILDEPTRGIDVGAKVEVHQLMADLAAQGMAIILISSELPEVLAMSDRILVMREGRQMAIFEHDEATQERVLSAAMGQPGDLMPKSDAVDREAEAAAVAAIDRLVARADDPSPGDQT